MSHNQISDLEAFSPAFPAAGFTDAGILVIGDLMLDRYIHGEVNRISPEAPVPVVAVKHERTVAGGAANVALNVAGLKARVVVAGVTGNDPAGRRLSEILSKSGVDLGGLLVDPSRPTTCKTRVVSGSHQIVRFDEEATQDLSADVSELLFDTISRLLNTGISGVILSDYAKGVLSENLTRSVISECKRKGVPTIVDPKREDYEPYSGSTCITPNQKEFALATTAMQIRESDLVSAGHRLRDRLDCSFLLITQGANGMTLVNPQQAFHLTAIAEEVFDVSGAGDTVVAVLATAFSSGLDIVTSVRLANAGASLVVRRAGTAPVHWDELYALVGKIFPLAENVLDN